MSQWTTTRATRPTNPSDAARRQPESGAGHRRNVTILDRIGWWRMCLIVWRATPLPWRLIAWPYDVLIYRRLFAASDTLRYLHAMHARQYAGSWLFRLVRPRYRRIEQSLRKCGLGDHPEDHAPT